MIVSFNAAFLLAAIISGAIKKWRDYYPTIVFLSFCNLLYNILAKEHLTWEFHPDFLLNHKTTDLANSFILLPSVAILYLHFYPSAKGKRIVYYLLWVAGFNALEYLWYVTERLTYHHGWNFAWSTVFYFAMFFAIRLHYTSVGKALLFSLAVAVFLILKFDVPLWK